MTSHLTFSLGFLARRGLLLVAFLAFPPGPATAQSSAAPIGVATMDADGTLRLDLTATGPSGQRGHARFVYRRGDKDYDMVLEHLGGMSPDDTKPVPPWPEHEKK